MRTIAALILLATLGGCAALPAFGSAPIDVTHATPAPRSRAAVLDDFWRARRLEAMSRDRIRPPAAFAAPTDPVLPPDDPSDGWRGIGERIMLTGKTWN